MVGLREAQPPLDKLEFQTVETCEIRMEPSLLCCDLKDMGTQWLNIHSTTCQTNPLILPPFVVLAGFPLARTKAGGNSPK